MLIVLAVVGLLAKTQLRAAHGGLVARSGEAASQAASGAGLGTPIVADQARDLEQKARDDVTRALQQVAERNDNAER